MPAIYTPATMNRFGRRFPMPHGVYQIQGNFAESESQTVVAPAGFSMDMAFRESTLFIQDLEGSNISVALAGFTVATMLGSSSVLIEEPPEAVDTPLAPFKMSMTLRAVTPEASSTQLPPGLWKRPKKKLPRKWAFIVMGEFDDTEYAIGTDFAPIVSTDGHWVVASTAAASNLSDLRDNIFIRSEASISQDSSSEGRP